jgi:hypothetical protein
MLFGCLASANSDRGVFEKPEQLNFHREVNRHVAFGVIELQWLPVDWQRSERGSRAGVDIRSEMGERPRDCRESGGINAAGQRRFPRGELRS